MFVPVSPFAESDHASQVPTPRRRPARHEQSEIVPLLSNPDIVEEPDRSHGLRLIPAPHPHDTFETVLDRIAPVDVDRSKLDAAAYERFRRERAAMRDEHRARLANLHPDLPLHVYAKHASASLAGFSAEEIDRMTRRLVSEYRRSDAAEQARTYDALLEHLRHASREVFAEGYPAVRTSVLARTNTESRSKGLFALLHAMPPNQPPPHWRAAARDLAHVDPELRDAYIDALETRQPLREPRATEFPEHLVLLARLRESVARNPVD